MNYKIIILLVFSLILISCEKIKPIEKNTTINNNEFSYTGIETCGIATCNFKDSLNEKKYLGELNLPDLRKYKNEFNSLILKYPKRKDLILSDNFKNFTDKINKDFFGCEGNIYKCKGSNPYGNDSSNFLFYIFIPKLVYENTYVLNNWTDNDIETTIQAIKRKDFKSTLEKEIIIKDYKKELLNKISKIDLNLIDKVKLKNDDEYFKEIILAPNGIHDYIIKEIYSIKVDWEEDEQMSDIVDFTTKQLYLLLEKIGISEKYFVQKIYEVNNYNKDITLIQNIVNEMEAYISTYNNETLNFPKDRYFRNDELYIFNGINEKTSVSLQKEILKVRHNVLLLFSLGKDEQLYALPKRLKLYQFENNFLLTNVFKFSKYIKVESNLNF